MLGTHPWTHSFWHTPIYWATSSNILKLLLVDRLNRLFLFIIFFYIFLLQLLITFSPPLPLSTTHYPAKSYIFNFLRSFVAVVIVCDVLNDVIMQLWDYWFVGWEEQDNLFWWNCCSFIQEFFLHRFNLFCNIGLLLVRQISLLQFLLL
jgi:hypothetical protein